MLKFIKKIKLILVFLIIFLFIIFLLSRGCIYKKTDLKYGVTFSKKQAEDLGLEWRAFYRDIFTDLGVRQIRLSAYWDEVEPKNNEFFFNNLDWQINTASEHGAEIILAVGRRLPRWPECHFPDWAFDLEKEINTAETLEYIKTVIDRYKDNENIIAWQIENEPFLPHFGECPDLDKVLLDKEIALARELDSRPIVLTDSGELSFWVPAAKRADIFGTTMYRDTYSEVLDRYIHYPIEPGFFRFKKNITRFFTRPERWLVIELQAEPWGPKPFQHLDKAEREKTMSLEKFQDMIEFSSKTGFKEFYLWGVEWWRWECVVNNDCALWEEARGLFEN